MNTVLFVVVLLVQGLPPRTAVETMPDLSTCTEAMKGAQAKLKGMKDLTGYTVACSSIQVPTVKEI